MNILHNFCLLVGMEPHDVFVPFEPGHLFTRVNAGILLDFPDSEFQCPFSVQILEHFFVSYGIERVQMPERIYLPGFFQQAVLMSTRRLMRSYNSSRSRVNPILMMRKGRSL